MSENAIKEKAKANENMVKIRLFKDQHRYNDDVIVGVNGKMYQIQRGVDVMVPASVAEVLQNSAAQDADAIRIMEELQQDADW